MLSTIVMFYSCIVINVSFVTVVYSYWIDQLLYCCHCYHSHTLMFMIRGNYRVSYKNARNFLKSWHFCLPTRLKRHLPGLWRDIRINMIFATRFLLALAISEVAVGLEDGGNSNIDSTYMYIRPLIFKDFEFLCSLICYFC